jgi:hypothetical protein
MLAQLVGIADPWDFNQHAIDPTRINFAGIREAFSDAEDWMSHVGKLATLADHGFSFYFAPHG